MSLPSLIFWAIFVLPLVALMVWIMRQDKKKGITGLIFLFILLVVGITYMYLKTGGK
ncbi:hypothetical protein [Mucilaginibacter myungsuensis]|uniref:Uncharacterized protein n=1 Tax=Mucilaginibacter myungsuensis TaxID=649104 RepID=A0A929KWW7_9SPHI|nr:hypothetical protein [Mucilaginibacter myungsuensis]MBE9661948.1 hypothetical protein [Mucilaginibacter myungsuensis]MDN3599619.1 hypothetical protein [Mucilaginibacter myungsuensis]